MKFVYGAAPKDPIVESGSPQQWGGLKQLGFKNYLLCIALSTAALTTITIFAFDITQIFSFDAYAKSRGNIFVLETALAILLISVIHECAHLLFTPGFGFSGNSIVGFWPRKGIFYVHYSGQVTKLQFLLFVSAPLLVLSLIPLCVGAIFNLHSPIIGLLAIFNSMLSGIDVITLILAWVEIPPQSPIRQSGDNVYFLKDTS